MSSSKELSLVLIREFLERCQYGESCTITKDELLQLKDNIELFMLRKFEEGRHVGRDHDIPKQTGGSAGPPCSFGGANEKK